ncbi:MAG: helix-hairpin-helix domain-containing protein [Candidatus Omnitrophica bacterium]|jgi:competence protein ComEA|nr:helix-hairpin-helix domain-containing protein [Candidatus Omnitrophota bacterium]MDD5690871.1 helix-hairpin-helix domain-containing protein [Candidatus Omnitrophota bacterium]
MINFTPEEKRVILFLLIIAFCGITLNNLAKLNYRVKKLFCPQVYLARIDLNKISLEELIKIRCLPVKTSQRIIAYRLQHGNFSSLEALKEIRGIGDQRYEKLKDIFFVE